MRVLVSCLPAYGHLYPIMPLADAFAAAGHHVVIATGPGAANRLSSAGRDVELIDATTDAAAGQVMREGLDFRALPPQERWRFGVAMFAGVLARQVGQQLAPVIARRRPDLVIYEEMTAGAAVAAGLAGVPAVRQGVGPWLPPPMVAGFAELLAQQWEDAGATPPPDLFGQLHLDIWPASLTPPGAGLPIASMPMRAQSWEESADPADDALAFLSQPRSRPVAYLTLGTVSTGEVEVLRAILDGLAAADVDVIAAVGRDLDRAALGPLAPGVHLEDFVPAAKVFPRVDLVVHHGGAGSVLGSLAAGLPQLVLPQRAADQFANAGALTEAGAGLGLMPGQVSAQAVTEAVTKLLADPAHALSASRLAKEIAAMPAPAVVVDQLVGLVSGRRVAAPVG